jgi:hypothetical protein
MAITLSSKVNSMLTALSEDGLTDVVKSASWTRTASEEVDGKVYTSSFPGVTPFSAPDPASFTPYDQITEAQVMGWVESKVDMAAIDATLTTNVENQINPPVVELPLPWAPPTTTTTTEEPVTTTSTTIEE